MANKEVTEREGHKTRRTAIIVAIVALAGTLFAASKLWRNMGGSSEPSITGRVVNARTEEPIRKADVSVTAGGVPENTESDSRGIFTARVPADATTIRIRVNARGYKPYDQVLPGRPTAEVPVNLEPDGSGRPVSSDSGSQRPSPGPPTAAKVSKASILDLSLPLRGDESGPWAVVVFGEQERRDDVTSSLRSVLGSSGRDTVHLFRKTSDEQRMASDLYRGHRGLFQELQAGRYCSNILVAKLSVTRIGATEGITFANATLSIHVVSPEGEMLKTFELSEKGGGEDDSSARRHAIDELLEALPRELPGKIS